MAGKDALEWRMANRLKQRGLGEDFTGGEYRNPHSKLPRQNLNGGGNSTVSSENQDVMYMGSAPHNAVQEWPARTAPGIKRR